jgi:hypothetical protein
MSGFKAPTDAILLPESFIKPGADLADTAVHLAEATRRWGLKYAVLFNGIWLTASPPQLDKGTTVAIEAARAVMRWKDSELEALKARIADLEK